MSIQDEFKKLHKQAAARKVNLEKLKEEVKAFPGSIEDIEGLFTELNEHRNDTKTGKNKGKILWVGLGIATVSIATFFIYALIPGLGPQPTATPQLATPTIALTTTPTIDLKATQTAQATNTTPTLMPTALPISAQFVKDLASIIPPVPFCGGAQDCGIWRLEAETNPVLQPEDRPSLAANATNEVIATWNMIGDEGFHLNGMVAIYLIDYSPYAEKPYKAASTGLLNYSVYLNEQNLVNNQIQLVDDDSKVAWVPLGLYEVDLGTKMRIEANMKAANNFLPIGPLLVVHFPDADQRKLESLSGLIEHNQIYALLDENSRLVQKDKDTWESEPGDGFGGNVIKLDANHPEIIWSLPAKLTPGKYMVYVYLPKNTEAKRVRCAETELEAAVSTDQQWYKSVEIEVPENTSEKFEFACTWNDDGTSEPIFLDGVAIVKVP